MPIVLVFALGMMNVFTAVAVQSFIFASVACLWFGLAVFLSWCDGRESVIEP